MLARTLFPVMLAAAVTVVALPAWAVPGDTLWTKTYDGPGSGVDAAGSVAWTARENGADDQGYVSDVGIGAGGVVFVTGRGTNTGSTLGPLTVAYPAGGGAPQFEAAVTTATASDGAWCLIPGPNSDRVSSEVAGPATYASTPTRRPERSN